MIIPLVWDRVISNSNNNLIKLYKIQMKTLRLALESIKKKIYLDLKGLILSNSGLEKCSKVEDYIKIRNPNFKSIYINTRLVILIFTRTVGRI